MCPMTSLFNLIGDPCKSMWNSSVKLDLFSSAIFKVHFFCKYWIISSGLLVFCVCSVHYYVGLSWLVLLRFLRCLKKSQPE